MPLRRAPPNRFGALVTEVAKSSRTGTRQNQGDEEMKRIVLIAAAAAFAAAPALAQKAEHSANKAAAAASLHYISKVTPDLWRTSEIKGLDVYSDGNEKIGSV